MDYYHSNAQFYKTLYYMIAFAESKFQTPMDLEHYLIYVCDAIIYSHQINGRIVFENFSSEDELIFDYHDAYIKSGDKVTKDLLSTDGYFNASLIYPNLPPLEALQRMSKCCLLVHDIHIPWNI